MDWTTRKVLSWRLSNTLDVSFCVEALEESIATYGKPEIKISMEGRGRYLNNISIERFWRSLKQEAVYLYKITDGFQVKRIIDNWIGFYNSERPHTVLDKRTPDAAYYSQTQKRKAACNQN